MKVRTTATTVTAILLAGGLALTARADNNWTGNAGDGLWSSIGNWSLGVLPASGQAQGNMFINNQTMGTTITLTGTASFDGDIFGPEWGMTLNINGGSL
ncbi:MAG TPA: hypothetical protein PKA41_20070, partial [Verrucomicrobiota bacterium]|nr:hypothetical protein [Verrucomicrobiota bacterium]